MNFYFNWYRNYQRSKIELTNLLNKKHPFKFDTFIIPLSVEVEVPTVPHFNDPANGKEDPSQLVCSSTFNVPIS